MKLILADWLLLCYLGSCGATLTNNNCNCMIVPSSLFAFYALLGCTEVSSFDVKSWQSTSSSGFTFPEDSLSEVQASKSVGLTFSGGGDRSYLASIGYLAAMHELGLLEDVKYIVGVSFWMISSLLFIYSVSYM